MDIADAEIFGGSVFRCKRHINPLHRPTLSTTIHSVTDRRTDRQTDRRQLLLLLLLLLLLTQVDPRAVLCGGLYEQSISGPKILSLKERIMCGTGPGPDIPVIILCTTQFSAHRANIGLQHAYDIARRNTQKYHSGLLLI